MFARERKSPDFLVRSLLLRGCQGRGAPGPCPRASEVAGTFLVLFWYAKENVSLGESDLIFASANHQPSGAKSHLTESKTKSLLQAGDAVYLTDQSLAPPEPPVRKDTVPSPTGHLPRNPTASATSPFLCSLCRQRISGNFTAKPLQCKDFMHRGGFVCCRRGKGGVY